MEARDWITLVSVTLAALVPLATLLVEAQRERARREDARAAEAAARADAEAEADRIWRRDAYLATLALVERETNRAQRYHLSGTNMPTPTEDDLRQLDEAGAALRFTAPVYLAQPYEDWLERYMSWVAKAVVTGRASDEIEGLLRARRNVATGAVAFLANPDER